eukprot:COSAG03_NODE_11646_length_582_cov_2.614907_1_plen_76_part_10
MVRIQHRYAPSEVGTDDYCWQPGTKRPATRCRSNNSDPLAHSLPLGQHISDNARGAGQSACTARSHCPRTTPKSRV